MESKDKSIKFRIFIFFIMLLVELILGSIILSRDYIISSVNSEIKMTASFLGDAAADRYHEKANNLFKNMFIETSLVEHSYNLWIPDKNKNNHGLEGMGQVVFDKAEEKINNMWNLVYKGVYRWVLFISWIPFFLPIIIPAVINGLMEREIKKLNYGYASPVRFSAAYKMILSTFIIVPIYLLFPIAIHPIVMPIWLAGLGIALLIMFSNLQKMI